MPVPETTREQAEDPLPILVAVHELAQPDGRICRLHVGNLTAACDGPALLAAGITAALNVSLNVDAAPLQLPDGTHLRRAKVGLIDGPGNTPAHLAAAVLALEGLVTQASPGKPGYPAHRAGHVLVHCRGGRSRSVAVLATYLHLRAPGAFPTLDGALAHIRRARGNPDRYPLPPMLDLARAALASGGLPALLRG
ncbi:MAG: protein phosphatase [Paracoccus aminovorans]|nr:protein phosphatase [Paracoccus aminovorans]